MVVEVPTVILVPLVAVDDSETYQPVSVSSKYTFSRLEQPENAEEPMLVTVEEILISVIYTIEVANYLHIKQNTYSQYENEKRQLSIDDLIKLAEFYKVTTDYILELED